MHVVMGILMAGISTCSVNNGTGDGWRDGIERQAGDAGARTWNNDGRGRPILVSASPGVMHAMCMDDGTIMT